VGCVLRVSDMTLKHILSFRKWSQEKMQDSNAYDVHVNGTARSFCSELGLNGKRNKS
jgi:hypothetical protein